MKNFAIHHATLFQDREDLTETADVGQRIACQDQQIGELAGFDRAEIAQPAAAIALNPSFACPRVVPPSAS